MTYSSPHIVTVNGWTLRAELEDGMVVRVALSHTDSPHGIAITATALAALLAGMREFEAKIGRPG